MRQAGRKPGQSHPARHGVVMHPFSITDQLVDDTLCTALEGGINYWATSARPTHWPDGNSKAFPGEKPFASEVLTMGSRLIISLDPDLVGDGIEPRYTLTLALMKKGIRKFCEMRGITPARLEDDVADASDAD